MPLGRVGVMGLQKLSSDQAGAGLGKKLACTLCQSERTQIIDTIDYSNLQAAYRDAFQVEIEKCLSEPYREDLVYLYECHECGLRFFSPKLAGGTNLYASLSRNSWYYGAEKWEFEFARSFARDVTSVLDIGCGSGNFLTQVKELSDRIRCVGLEFTPESAEAARKKGHEVYEQSIETFAADTANLGAYDLICSFQVLEHVGAPSPFLTAIVECLKPGGVLVLSTPNRSGFAQFAINDLLNLPPHHLTHWNRETFEYLAKRYPLSLEKSADEPVAHYHRDWYRTTLLTTRISKLLGFKFATVEIPRKNPGYRLAQFGAKVIDRLIPKSVWNYSLPGHTICVALRKIS